MSEQTMVRHTLPNGLRVLILPMPHTRAATVSVFCGAGSRYEPYDLMGLSHFMEHMLFKGTAQRPDPQEIAEAVERTGGLPQRKHRSGSNGLVGQSGVAAPRDCL